MARRLAAGAELVLATHNNGKLREIAAMLGPHAVERRLGGRAGPARAGGERTRFRRQRAAEGAGGGASQRAAGAGGRLGLLRCRAGRRARRACRRAGRVRARTSPGRWRRVQKALSEAGTKDRRAWFVCVLCLAWPDGHAEIFEGRVDGTAVWPPRGTTRLRLRPDVRAGGRDADVRRNDARGKARSQPSRPRLRAVAGGLLAGSGEGLTANAMVKRAGAP